MYKSDSFYITDFELSDAKSLNDLMRSNTERFRDYFPMTLSQNLTVDDTREYILRKAFENEKNTEYTFAIKDLGTTKVVGIIILKDIEMTQGVGELAYAIDKNFEGKGWMSLAVKELSKYALDTLGLKTIKIIAHRTNVGSCKVATKNGYVWTKTLKNEHTPPNGSPLNMELYELKSTASL